MADRNRKQSSDDRNREEYGDINYGSDYNRGNQASLRGGYGDSMDYGDMSGGDYGGAYSSDYGAPYGSIMGSSYGNSAGYNQFTPNWRSRSMQGRDQGSYGGGYSSGVSGSREEYGRQKQNTGRYSESDVYGGGYGDRRRDTGSDFRNINTGAERMGQGGSFRGRGPRGYTRSSERIREDVCDRLTDDPSIDATDMSIRVENNEVILTGIVHTRDEKRRAEDLAESVRGVANVRNELRIQRDDEGRR